MRVARKSGLRIEVKPAVRKRLVRLAEASGRTPEFLVNDALEAYVQERERMLEEVAQADRQVRAGHFFRHADMKAWVASLASTASAAPKCSCGKRHDGAGLCK